MPYFEHDGVRGHYTVRGKGKLFIFLHGLGGSIAQTEGTLGNIAGYQCIFPDQRAHGLSTSGDMSRLDYENLASDVRSLASKLGFERFSIGGISMGAAVAVKTALLFPEAVERLVLVRVAILAGPSDERAIRWYDALTDYLEKHDIEGFLNTGVFKEIQTDAPITANTFLGLFSDKPSLTYPQKFRVIPRLTLIDSLERLRAVRAPTLILSNRYDPAHPFEYGEIYYDKIPGSQFFEVTSKAVNQENHRRDLTRRIREFLMPE